MFVLAYQRGDNYANEDAFNEYFLPKIKIEKYNIEIDGRNFYDQAINDSIKQYDEVRKISTRQGDDYTINLSKQKALHADPKAIQETIFTDEAPNNTIRVYYILEQSKETILEFAKGTAKVL